jgi:hypothetical protein
MRVEIYCEVSTRGVDPSLIKRSLEPDNIDLPEGMSLDIRYSDEKVMINLKCSTDKILTCRSTIDEILMLIDSILKSLERQEMNQPDSS